VTPYRERLTAPLSWWIAALGFALVGGWVFLIATTWTIAIVIAVLLAAAAGYAVWRYGSVTITVGTDGVRVGRAFVEAAHVGTATALDRAAYRTRLGTGADARAHLMTRPYLDHGVVVTIDDPADPTPYWLVSSRHPAQFAEAVTAGVSAQPAVHDPNGDPGGEEA
jgi:hypothetical protein